MTGDNPANNNNPLPTFPPYSSLPDGKHVAPSREQVTALTSEIGKLQVFADQVTKQRKDDKQVLRRVRNLVRFDIGLSVVLFAVSTFLGITLAVNRNLIHQLDVQQQQIDAQQTREAITRDQALCPLYTLLIGSANPKSRLAYPGGPDAYDAAFVTLRKATAALTCTN